MGGGGGGATYSFDADGFQHGAVVVVRAARQLVEVHLGTAAQRNPVSRHSSHRQCRAKWFPAPHVQGPGHAFNGSDVTTLPDIHLPGVDLHDSSPGLLVRVGQLDLSVQSAFRHDNQNVNAWCSILITTLPHFSLQGRGEFTPDLSRAGSRMSTRLVAAIT